MCNNQCDQNSDLSSCPFSFSAISEEVQNYGCLPSPFEIVQMRVKHGKTWACHQAPDQVCLGAISYLKKNNMPYSVLDKKLITEKEDWSQYL